jgi:phosphoribosylglycinamide formyltransferase-1
MLDIAFLASNNGSAMRAIVAAIEDGRLSARAVLVVSNRASAAALDFAAAHSIPSLHIATTPDPVAADVALRSALETCGAGLVVMSGYLRKLGPQTLQALPGRILNVHPSLLPDFGGDGMYGRRVHEAVLASGAGVSGATIHVVDGDYDRGKIIASQKVPVLESDDAVALEARVMAAECELFVSTLVAIAEGSLSLE